MVRHQRFVQDLAPEDGIRPAVGLVTENMINALRRLICRKSGLLRVAQQFPGLTQFCYFVRFGDRISISSQECGLLKQGGFPVDDPG